MYTTHTLTPSHPPTIHKQHRTCSISFHSALSKYRMCNVHHSHPHTLTPSHPHTLTPSHPHILTSSHPHTLTPIHMHMSGSVTVLDMSTFKMPSPPLPHLFLLTLLHPLRHKGPEGLYSSGVYSGLLSRETSLSRNNQVGQEKPCTLELELLFGFPDLLLMS